MMSEHWPRGTLVTRLYERDSLALSLIRSSGETRAHRSPSARPAFLTVRRLLYSNDSFHSFSSTEFCSAYLTLTHPYIILSSAMRAFDVHLFHILNPCLVPCYSQNNAFTIRHFTARDTYINRPPFISQWYDAVLLVYMFLGEVDIGQCFKSGD